MISFSFAETRSAHVRSLSEGKGNRQKVATGSTKVSLVFPQLLPALEIRRSRSRVSSVNGGSLDNLSHFFVEKCGHDRNVSGITDNGFSSQQSHELIAKADRLSSRLQPVVTMKDNSNFQMSTGAGSVKSRQNPSKVSRRSKLSAAGDLSAVAEEEENLGVTERGMRTNGLSGRYSRSGEKLQQVGAAQDAVGRSERDGIELYSVGTQKSLSGIFSVLGSFVYRIAVRIFDQRTNVVT